MSLDRLAQVLGGWEGHTVALAQRFEPGVKGPRAEVWIELWPARGQPRICSGCGLACAHVHEVTERWVRDLPVLGADTWLLVHRRRLCCPRCGPKLERLSWLDPYARVTRRLAESVARLCALLPVKHAAELCGLDWKTVKAIDKAPLRGCLGPADLAGVEVIAMDEFAIRRGHRCATVVVEPQTRRVLWVGRGRRREDVRPFFDLLGEEGCRRLRAVVMDMNGAHEQEVREHCPQAQIVYDLFHVVAKCGREVIDRVRVDEANRLRSEPDARRLVKGARWLLLRRRENLRSDRERLRLDALLRANRRLLTVYGLKEDLGELWSHTDPEQALRAWDRWYGWAVRSRIEPLRRFARRLKSHLSGILAHCWWPLHTSVLEGINNKIKVIKRMAHGFRDDEHFFLKIRAAFPGIGR